MLMIRLSRVGKKKKAYFRLIISEKTKDPYGRALEILGSYDPHTKKLQAKKEKIEYWLGQGAQMSPTVLWCNENCVFCWRPMEWMRNVNLEDVEVDEPRKIISGTIKQRQKLIPFFS